MAFHHQPFGPPPRIILESIDLLLARLGQLGHYVRDTVARIVGSSVAEAVSEALRLIVHRMPARPPAVFHADPWSGDVDPYDPYAEDELIAAQAYQAARYAAEPASDWRRLLRWLTTNVLALSQCVWHWSVMRRGRIAWAMAVGIIALFLARTNANTSTA